MAMWIAREKRLGESTWLWGGEPVWNSREERWYPPPKTGDPMVDSPVKLTDDYELEPGQKIEIAVVKMGEPMSWEDE